MRRILRLLFSLVLSGTCLFLLMAFLSYRETNVRYFTAFGFALSFFIMVVYTLRPIWLWWCDPQSRLLVSFAPAALAFAKLLGKRGAPARAQLSYDTGILLLSRCRFKDAASHLQEAVDLFHELGDKENEAMALMELGNCHTESGDAKAAAEVLQRALVEMENLSDTQRADNTWRLLNNLSGALCDGGNLDSAEDYARRAIQTCQQHHKTEGPELAVCSLNLAEIHRKQRKYRNAEELLQHSLDVLDKGRDENFVFGVMQLAMLRDDQDCWKEAEELYKQSRTMLEMQLGPGHAQVARVLEHYAAMLDRAGRERDAAFAMARAAGIRDTIG